MRSHDEHQGPDKLFAMDGSCCQDSSRVQFSYLCSVFAGRRGAVMCHMRHFGKERDVPDWFATPLIVFLFDGLGHCTGAWYLGCVARLVVGAVVSALLLVLALQEHRSSKALS